MKGGEIHTVSGDVIRDGVVIVRDGKIVAVGAAATTAVPDGQPAFVTWSRLKAFYR